jgi:hypothetical protein
LGRINIVLTYELEKNFRTEVVKRLGYRKGNISLAVSDAIKDWIKKGD